MTRPLARNEIAAKIFEDIRDRPYRVALSGEKPADNCYFKGTELIRLLTTLGYTVRARVGEIDWHDGPYPADVLALLDTSVLFTHFYPEIMMDDGNWFVLDPSWNKNFAQKYNLPFSEFGAANMPCFRIKKLYEPDEQAPYAWGWLSDKKVIEDYMAKTGAFFAALNGWLERENP
ncbi:MAG: hypothetical protein GC136_02805 [Alphaproteobacteria bacterium]|nr:hypothetical protein [Alphaproteobacteria bacterium]